MRPVPGRPHRVTHGYPCHVSDVRRGVLEREQRHAGNRDPRTLDQMERKQRMAHSQNKRGGGPQHDFEPDSVAAAFRAEAAGVRLPASDVPVPRTPPAPGTHGSAVIDPSARIAADAHIGAFVSIGARSVVEAGAIVGAGCVIGEDCVIGEGCELVARATLVTRVRLGKRVLVHPGAVLGADGFGIAMDHGRWIKVPQLGGVMVGDDCEIGANTSIDRGALGDTVLEEDVRLDNQIQVGHNVRIGAHTAMAGCSAVAGSAVIGRHCLVGGGAGILGHLEICDRVVITAMSLVTHSIREPGEYSSGTPLMDNRSWRRSAARFKQLDDIARRSKAGDKDPE